MTAQRSTSQPTHVAYADETNYNVGRYRGVALVTLRLEDAAASAADLRKLLDHSGVAEFEWKQLDDAKRRFAALKMLEYTVGKAMQRLLRVDVLTWDTEDSRHKIRGRDDIANLQLMYYKVFKNVLRQRWPDGSVWRLCPDEHTAMDWDRMEDFLGMASTRLEARQDLFTGGQFRLRLKQEFSIQEIVPSKSLEQPLVQLADLFAGLAVYSRPSYGRYEHWESISSRQLELFEQERGEPFRLSLSDHERCQVLGRFVAQCKSRKLGVSLKTERGLKTFDPRNAINFWWYQPQNEEDKAPLRSAQRPLPS